ncbi:MAG: dihydrodipicolinate synthase family protein [Anaerolineales bacterium]|nr:dihydrodipicolinate synthase family protein [Anaerolineales bacterium]
MDYPRLTGVFAAALTPLKPDFKPDIDILPIYLSFLANRGCHGALLSGTTGEGPSFSQEERIDIWNSAISVRDTYPNFRLLAGTGTPSLEETINLTSIAFNLGMDGVVILPPYYFRNISQEGLFQWFSEVIRKSVPSGGIVLGYHIPHISGVPLSIQLLKRLKDTFHNRMIGVKDSSGTPEFAKELGIHLRNDFITLTGNDKLFSLALKSGGSGCITAAANLVSPQLRKIWDHHQQGIPDNETQSWVSQLRAAMDDIPPAPALLKFLLAHYHKFPRWTVRPPLLPLSSLQEQEAISKIVMTKISN